MDVGYPPNIETVILRDRGPGNGKSSDIEYQGTEATRQMSAMLARYNALLQSTFIDIPILERPGLDGNDDDRSAHVIVSHSHRAKFVRRVFNRGSFDQGGRFYGGWWQRCPKEWRARIFINDEPTTEIDYTGLHLVLLYAWQGLSYWHEVGGSLSERIARRFPQARIVAIDLDPVLLALGRRALTQFDGRLRFVQADLASATWRTALGDARPHAAVSSTALHWLLPEQQVALYREVQDALRAGGVFLNADHQRFDERTPVWKDWAERHDTQTQEAGWAAGAETWETWWAEASATEGLAERVAERQALFANRPQSLPTTVGFHIAALRQAGFAEAGTVWQLFDDYVLAACKAGAAR